MVEAGSRRRPSGFHVLSRKQAVGIRPLRLLLPVDEISLLSCAVVLSAAKFHCMVSTHSFHSHLFMHVCLYLFKLFVNQSGSLHRDDCNMTFYKRAKQINLTPRRFVWLQTFLKHYLNLEMVWFS